MIPLIFDFVNLIQRYLSIIMQQITNISQLEIGKQYYFESIDKHTLKPGIKRIAIYNGYASSSTVSMPNFAKYTNTIMFTNYKFITHKLAGMTCKGKPFRVYVLREDYAIYPCIWHMIYERRIFATIIMSIIPDKITAQMLACEFFPDDVP